MAAVCKQYGPGRLPYADRQDIGAGYAMSTTAAVTAVLFVLVGQIPGVSEATTIGPFWFGYLGIPSGSAAVMYAAVAIPVVIPSAFVAGVIAWRSASPELPRFGPFAGTVATGLTSLFGSLAVSAILIVLRIIEDPSQLRMLSTVGQILFGMVYFVPTVGVFAFMVTFWLTLPLGALGGSIYERTRRVS